MRRSIERSMRRSIERSMTTELERIRVGEVVLNKNISVFHLPQQNRSK